MTMALETATYISDLVTTNPTSTDPKSQGDDHIRLIKSALKTTLPNITGAVSATHTELSYSSGVTSAIQAQINAKAPIASPTFTGTVTVPTPSNATDASTKGYVDSTAFSSALPAQTGNSGKLVTTNGTVASWTPIKTINGSSLLSSGDVATGMQLVATVTPANGVSSASVTGIGVYKNLMFVVDSIVLASAAGISFALSSNNGSSYGTAKTFTFTGNATPRGYATIYKTDTSGSNKPYFTIAVSTAGADVDSSITGIVNAVQFALSAATTFTGSGSIYIYGNL